MIYFAKYGYQVSGVDVTQAEMELAELNLKREGIKAFSLKVMNNEILDFPGEEFDIVLCWKTIYHAGSREKIKKLMSEMVRVLKRGKPIIISTLENDSMHIVNSEKIGENMYKYRMPGRSDGENVFYYHFENSGDFIDLLKQHGIGNIEIGSSSGYLLHKMKVFSQNIKRSLRIFYGEKM